MNFAEMLQWQNLVFFLPGVAAIFYLVVLSATGLGGDADHVADEAIEVTAVARYCEPWEIGAPPLFQGYEQGPVGVAGRLPARRETATSALHTARHRYRSGDGVL